MQLPMTYRKSKMTMEQHRVDQGSFIERSDYPYDLREQDFLSAMQDVYDFFFDVNTVLSKRGLGRLDDILRPAAMSGIISDMLTLRIASHSRALTENTYFNGHPDLVLKDKYPNNSVDSGKDGIEIKTTRKPGGAVDTHGARDQWMCVFVYRVDNETEPAMNRRPMTFTEVYLAFVKDSDFRTNSRSRLGTRTATLHKGGLEKLRAGCIYFLSRP